MTRISMWKLITLKHPEGHWKSQMQVWCFHISFIKFQMFKYIYNKLLGVFINGFYMWTLKQAISLVSAYQVLPNAFSHLNNCKESSRNVPMDFQLASAKSEIYRLNCWGPYQSQQVRSGLWAKHVIEDGEPKFFLHFLHGWKKEQKVVTIQGYVKATWNSDFSVCKFSVFGKQLSVDSHGVCRAQHKAVHRASPNTPTSWALAGSA